MPAMAKIIKDRVHAIIEGDFVVFIIGLRINSPLKINKWLPVATATPKMLKESYGKPESGFLGSMGGFPFYGAVLAHLRTSLGIFE